MTAPAASCASAATPLSTPTPASPSPPVVLVVDLDQGLLPVLSQPKEPTSHEVCTVSTAADALRFLETHRVVVLVTPVRVSDMSGCEFLQWAVEIQDDLLFILVGGPEDRRVAVPMMACHPVTYVQTPVEAEEFQIHIRRCLERGQERVQLRIEMAQRKRAEADSERALFARIAVSALLETGLEALTFQAQLNVALDIILTVPWLAAIQKGAVFVVDKATGHLRLEGRKHLSDHRLVACAQVPLGHCLCGKAGASREIIFSGHSGEEDCTLHRASGQAHGHYCVPIIGRDDLVGVLNLWVLADHQRTEYEAAFMTTMANTLAIIIEHRQVEAGLKEAEDRLRHLAYHDPLTGLRNRQSFNAVMDKIFVDMRGTGRRQGDAAPEGAFLSVLDIDHFKKVNDVHGHMIGDEVLVLFARQMKACFRDRDATFRFGGEEFLVLLYDISLPLAEAALDRFRQMIESYDFPQVGRVTVSIGAVRMAVGALPGDLIEKADKAIYHAKSHGRNQVHFYHALIESGDLAESQASEGAVDLW